MTEIKPPIEKCITCERYDHEQGRMKNRLRCTFGCEDYKQKCASSAIAYNRAVSGEEYDYKVLYEHGKKVFGSGGQ